MASNSLPASSNDRRNIASLLNPSDKIDSPPSSAPSAPLQLNPYSQQTQSQPQGMQHTTMTIVNITGASQSHLFPPLPPDHPVQTISVQSANDSNTFRLSRASWEGGGPPPEGFEGSLTKRILPAEEEIQRKEATVSKNDVVPNTTAPKTPNEKHKPSKKQRGKSKLSRTKAAAAVLPPSQIQYPTEPYILQNSHCTQPSVGLGVAVATPIPLAPPQLPPTANSKMRWKKNKHTPSANDAQELTGSSSQLQSTERVSVRLAVRGNVPTLQAASSGLEVPSQHIPHGQPFEQGQNPNGKRTLPDVDGGPREPVKRRKKNVPLPVFALRQPFSPFGMSGHLPMQIPSEEPGEIPLDPAFFQGGPHQHYVPDQEPVFFREQNPLPPDLDPSQVRPSQPPQYAFEPANPPEKLVPELQFARCMSSRYKPDPFPRCVSCTRRWAGDTCRFQGIRFLLRDPQKHVLGVSFVDSQTPDGPNMRFPDSWNVALKPSMIERLKRVVARALLPTLKDEQIHLRLPEVIRRPRETDVRTTCDTCMTSVFACSWMCRICGREACRQCYEQIRELTFPTRALKPNGGKKQHPNPLFLSCNKRLEHAFSDFSPVSRFCWVELEFVVKEMEDTIAYENEELSNQDPVDTDDQWTGEEQNENSDTVPGPIMTTTETSSVRTSPDQLSVDRSINTEPRQSKSIVTPVHPSTSAVPLAPFASPRSVEIPLPVQARYGDPIDPAGVPSHPYHVFEGSIAETQFQSLWTNGNALVVSGLLNNFSMSWTPEYFIQNYDQCKCVILECHTDENKSVRVGEFFRQFGNYDGRSNCWKLKDWPPSSDFKTTFPDLYTDFIQAVPIPNYTRRDGALNIASHFPTNTIAPDLGPKMYNAFASSEVPGFKGSTRLHMDMADAVNIMLYAAKRPDGGEGMAAWDIFRSEDTQKIRRFLRKHFKGQYANDPIHSQTLYMDILMRKRLYEEFGVCSWRIYQKPGDAVFIPAGCPHQVVNLSDCIKVACDFVSPENVARCSMLTREFRDQNKLTVWKEDVLQLSAMLWFCWLNLCRIESPVINENDEDDEEGAVPE